MRHSSLIFFINYLNINFLYYKDNTYRQYLEKTKNDKFLKELDTTKNNAKFTTDLSSHFLQWLLRHSVHQDLIELYYALMDENIRKANEYCEAMQRPPSVPWLVLPKNLKGLLSEKTTVKLSKKEKTYDEVAYQPTNLGTFI